MNKVIAIDPGIKKCGIVIADLEQKKVCEALVLKSEKLLIYVERIYQNKNQWQFLIGNGTSSKKHINSLKKLIPCLIVAEEKNSTYRAKERYFEIFPLSGLMHFLPREIFILNKNLDAVAALIIMEDYFRCKFEMKNTINTKTWLK